MARSPFVLMIALVVLVLVVAALILSMLVAYSQANVM